MSITPKQVLDRAMSHIQDNSATMRSRMLGFLNTALQVLAAERDWRCLHESEDIGVVDGVLVLPSNFAKFHAIIHPEFALTPKNQLTAAAQAKWVAAATSGNPRGFVFSGNLMILYPSINTIVEFKFSKEVSEVIDDTTPLPFPIKFLPLLVRSLLDAYYEYDKDTGIDGRLKVSLNLNAELLRTLKVWDNNQQAMPSIGRYIKE